MTVCGFEWEVLRALRHPTGNHFTKNWDSLLRTISEKINGRRKNFIPLEPSNLGFVGSNDYVLWNIKKLLHLFRDLLCEIIL